MSADSRPDSVDSSDSRSLSSQEFRDIIGHFASGVTVVTTRTNDEDFGTTASAVCSLSTEPPMVLICMNRQSTTGQAIVESRTFAINVLNEGQTSVAEDFARSVPNKFANIRVTRGALGQPLLPDALAHLECRVTEETYGGTHIVFLAEVENATAHSGTPLAYYRGHFGRIAIGAEQAVYDNLREAVLSGRLDESEPLDLEAIATEFGAPNDALYHALGKLTGERFLERSPQGVYTVPPITLKMFTDALDAACAIQLGVIDLVLSARAKPDLGVLRSQLDNSLPADRDRSHLKYRGALRATMDFHTALVGLAESDALSLSFTRLAVAGVFERTLSSHRNVERISSLAEARRSIVNALEVRDAKKAREAVIELRDLSAEAARIALAGEP